MRRIFTVTLYGEFCRFMGETGLDSSEQLFKLLRRANLNFPLSVLTVGWVGRRSASEAIPISGGRWVSEARGAPPARFELPPILVEPSGFAIRVVRLVEPSRITSGHSPPLLAPKKTTNEKPNCPVSGTCRRPCRLYFRLIQARVRYSAHGSLQGNQ